MSQEIQVVDSHTAGEPTRIIIAGGPDLGSGHLAERVSRFREHHDSIRRAVILEPRGWDVLVGGLLTEPTDPRCSAGILFFNNHDYLGMCGHGTIGLMTTLKFLGRIEDGVHRIETPVGIVTAEIHGDQTAVENVPSYRFYSDITVDVPGHGPISGDVAWGGNWFFLAQSPIADLSTRSIGALTQLACGIDAALQRDGITGRDGARIDHIELFGPPVNPENDSRNFVLCPGGAYDRSPCGTGTSAKLACLAADGLLEPETTWKQESIIGSVFEASYRNPVEEPGLPAGSIIPTIRGEAFVTSQATLLLNHRDPFCLGIQP